MNTLRKIGILLGIFAFMGLNAQEVTDYDLQNFARAYNEMMAINKKAQKEMTDAIEKEGLDLETYHAINDSKDTEFIPDIPEKKFKDFENLQPKLQKIQKQLEADVEKAFNKYDLSKREYQAIAERVKQDQLLQIKLEQILTHLR
ncbi:DUF4168 domain-containing protein [Moheibacter sp.]|uniref:DUF4168 domain-containing protein n=1 Tax=Moheibacter sp. TaxID=1965316 RepID=UPI003C77BFC6